MSTKSRPYLHESPGILCCWYQMHHIIGVAKLIYIYILAVAVIVWYFWTSSIYICECKLCGMQVLAVQWRTLYPRPPSSTFRYFYTNINWIVHRVRYWNDCFGTVDEIGPLTAKQSWSIWVDKMFMYHLDAIQQFTNTLCEKEVKMLITHTFGRIVHTFHI